MHLLMPEDIPGGVDQERADVKAVKANGRKAGNLQRPGSRKKVDELVPKRVEHLHAPALVAIRNKPSAVDVQKHSLALDLAVQIQEGVKFLLGTLATGPVGPKPFLRDVVC